MMKKDKRGISPLIATVIIIGLTIVLAALVVTFGTNLVKKTTEDTETQASLATACSNVALNLKLKASVADGSVQVSVDNSGTKKLEGFIFRVYNVGETTVDSFDTSIDADQLKITTTTPNDYTISANGIKTFDLDYDETTITEPVKVGVKPKVTILGKTETCGETTREL